MNTTPRKVAELPGALLCLGLLLAGLCAGIRSAAADSASAGDAPWVSPSAVAVSQDGGTLFVASATSGEVLLLDARTLQVTRRLPVPGEPSGLALLPGGTRLLVTTAGPDGALHLVEWREARVLRSVPAGSGATAPVASSDGATAFVCLRFEKAVVAVDLTTGLVARRVAVEREPVAAALAADGRTLFVANHLPVGRSDVGEVSAHVTVIDTASGEVLKQVALPSGGNLVRDVRLSPDGRHVCVTHTLARYTLPTTQVERGWMNSNAMTLIEVASLKVWNTVLLDQVERGSANPWGAAWSGDGRYLVVAHAGTHELSVIDVPRLLAKLDAVAKSVPGKASPRGYVVSQTRADVPHDLTFLAGLRELVALGGNGPRAVAMHGSRVFVGNYFSESVSVVDLAAPARSAVEVPLHPARPMSEERRGEALFNDARLCMESWQSCASCHSAEARVDALNWDLVNDGRGNAKNTKSLVRSHVTAPAMSLGIRATAEVAVRAGIHHILFTEQPDDVPAAMDAWLSSLRPHPSPHLVRGELSPAAQRGRALFMDASTGCAVCHPPPLYTTRESYDVGTLAGADSAPIRLDTPTLLEVWRTAPYLHDGSAATLRDVLLGRNAQDQHGRSSHLSESELQDLMAFVMSL